MQDESVPSGSDSLLSWGEFRKQRPDLADAGRQLLYQFGVGLAFLSTVRPDGGPRLHPICPVLTESGIYALIILSPKLADLRRDGRFALHSFPGERNEDAFYVTGSALVVESLALRSRVERQFLDERPALEIPAESLTEQTLLEFFIERCLLSRTNGHGDPNPRHEIWHAG